MSIAAESPLPNAKLLAKRPYEGPVAPELAAADASATLAAAPFANTRGRAAAAGAGAAADNADRPTTSHHRLPSSSDRAYVLGAAVLTALRGLFPEMSEQVRQRGRADDAPLFFFACFDMAVCRRHKGLGPRARVPSPAWSC